MIYRGSSLSTGGLTSLSNTIVVCSRGSKPASLPKTACVSCLTLFPRQCMALEAQASRRALDLSSARADQRLLCRCRSCPLMACPSACHDAGTRRVGRYSAIIIIIITHACDSRRHHAIHTQSLACGHTSVPATRTMPASGCVATLRFAFPPRHVERQRDTPGPRPARSTSISPLRMLRARVEVAAQVAARVRPVAGWRGWTLGCAGRALSRLLVASALLVLV